MRELQCALVATTLLTASWVVGLFHADVAVIVLQIAATVVGIATFAPSAVRNLRHGQIGVGTLMTVAAIGATALGEFGEAAMLGILFSVAEGLEHHAVTRTRRGLRALLSLVPPTAVVIRDRAEIVVPPDDLLIGDMMVLRPGERAATDGVIRTGTTSLDVSAITGESVPVEAVPGSPVYAGSINGGGVVTVNVTARASDSSLARIVHLVEDAQERKGSGQRLADRIARPLVPAIIILAVAIGVLGSLLGDPRTWVERALVVLVATSPCALAIAVPLTVVAAVGAASRSGALIKGGAALEKLGCTEVIAIDKTGTLTRNEPRIIAVETVGGVDQATLFGVAAALEAHSEHPLAPAILAAASAPGTADDVVAVPGNGIEGTVANQHARLGRPGWISSDTALADDIRRWQEQGATVVLVEHGHQMLGMIAIRDELRAEAAEAVRLLCDRGIDVVMLTGDNTPTAKAIAAQAGITTVHAELRPEAKAALVTEMQRTHRGVAMVGDGVNDAPALATADTGIAMGAMGTDVAIESADVALMGDDLRHLPQLLAQAARARRIMLQNITLALLIIGVLIPLAAWGILGLALVVLIHESAEVLVILNAIRAARVGRTPGLRVTPTAPRADHHVRVAAPAHRPGDGCCPPAPDPTVALPPAGRTNLLD